MVHLGMVLLAASVSAAPVQREAAVRALSVTVVDGVPTGRVVPLTARLSPNRARVPSVGIMEEGASGSAERWLTTLWQAAFVATRAADASLLDAEFLLRVGGPIDGPSAGLLTAATLAALLKGKKVRPHTTLLGSLNPDGSAGPVDAVLPRLQAAAADGVKRLGVPLGARQQLDASGAPADLLVEGKKLGVEVKELGSLDEAFTFLTGATLPRPAPVDEAALELWPAELAALTRLTAQVRNDFEAERPLLDEAQEGADPRAAAAWKGLLERATREAADLVASGDTVRAMVVWSASLGTLRVAAEDARLTRALETKELATVLAELQAREAALSGERQKLAASINAQFPNTTRANDIYAMDLLESVVTQGRALRGGAVGRELAALLGAGELSEAQRQQFKRRARQYAEDLVRDREELENGRRFLALYAALPPMKRSRGPIDAPRLAPWYVSAGAAAQASFKARTDERAFAQDATWLDLVGYGELLATESDARARLVLAARQLIYSGYLVNTYDALGGRLDTKGALTIRNARALAGQLELAKLRVLQSCGQARRAVGSIPFPARMRFLNARAAREGSDRQKADALADLWIANWWCEFSSRDTK